MKIEYEEAFKRKDKEIADLTIKLKEATAKLEELNKKLVIEQMLRSDAES